MEPRIEIPHDKIVAFCEKWQIVELSLFGSVLREDFGPDSDVDVLVTFAEGARPTSIDEWLTAEAELRELLDREVDLVERATIEAQDNYIRRRRILSSARSVYVRG